MLTYIISALVGIIVLAAFVALISEIRINKDVFIFSPTFLGEVFIARTIVGRQFIADISDTFGTTKSVYWAPRGVADPAAQVDWLDNRLDKEWTTRLLGSFLVRRLFGSV